MHCEHRARRLADDVLGDAAHQQTPEAGSSVRAHHDKIDGMRFRVPEDLDRGQAPLDGEDRSDAGAFLRGQQRFELAPGVLFDRALDLRDRGGTLVARSPNASSSV